jgi:hypothetical protein
MQPFQNFIGFFFYINRISTFKTKSYNFFLIYKLIMGNNTKIAYLKRKHFLMAQVQIFDPSHYFRENPLNTTTCVIGDSKESTAWVLCL